MAGERDIRHAAKQTKMLDELRKNCTEGSCVNYKCNGNRHFNISGEKWGSEWDKTPNGS